MPDLPFLAQWKRKANGLCTRQLLCQVPSLSSASGLLCRGGRRSQGARRVMAREGFSNVPPAQSHLLLLHSAVSFSPGRRCRCSFNTKARWVRRHCFLAALLPVPPPRPGD